jgi:hypothetical protein
MNGDSTVDATAASLGNGAPDNDLRLSDRIREQPLLSLGVGVLCGFVAGGGASTRTGMAILISLGRIAAREAASSAFSRMVSDYDNASRRSGADRS